MPHINRAVNDPLFPSDAYKSYGYATPMRTEEDLAKTIDINKLEFSLDDFQNLSNGNYNAGQFCITDSGKLDIVNNHKYWTILNHKSIEGEDCYAIRVAFAKAMEAGGLDNEAMKVVRKELGLGEGYTATGGISLKPLTRQEVRQLIDANIDALNAKRAADNQLQTYDQIHARYSEEANKDIVEAREEITRTGGARNIRIDSELANLMAVTKKNPSFEGLSKADVEDYIEFIDELSTALEHLQDDEARYDWMRENRTEYKVTVVGGALGMAIALDGGHVVFDTISNGKRSRIDFGFTPERLRRRLERSQELLFNIKNLEVGKNIKLGKDNTGKNIVNGKNVINGKDVIKIKEDIPSVDHKRNAQKNINTLAILIARQLQIDSDSVADIIKKVDGWEDKLAQCSTSGNPDTIDDLNNDLRNFLFENKATIEPLLKEVPIAMGEKY